MASQRQTARNAHRESDRPEDLASLLKDEAREALTLVLDADVAADPDDWDRESGPSTWSASADNFSFGDGPPPSSPAAE